MKTTKQTESKVLDKLVSLMDSAIKIPGTNIRFGLDALIGLIPGAGDATSLLISGGLILMMAKKGITTKLAAQMLVNVAIDYVVGSVPLLGDLFDVGFKANERNLKLLKDYHKTEGDGGGKLKTTNVALIFMMVITVTVLFILFALYLSFKIGELILSMF